MSSSPSSSSEPPSSSLAPSPAPTNSVVIKGYTVEVNDAMLMGVGGFGVVLRATARGEQVALKVMVGSQPHITASALHEHDTLFGDSALPMHKNVVVLHSYEEVDGSDESAQALIGAVSVRLRAKTDDPVAQKHRLHESLEPEQVVHLLAYEVLAGPTLYDMLVARRSPLLLSEVLPLFRQLAAAVAHCHAHGVAHLDVKLENALVVDGGRRLVLIDFGLARPFPLPAPLQERNPPGSPTFIAPEVRAACEPGGAGLFDGHRADVFSLGVVLYSLLVGCYPWRDTVDSDSVYLRFSRTGHLSAARRLEPPGYAIGPPVGQPTDPLVAAPVAGTGPACATCWHTTSCTRCSSSKCRSAPRWRR